MASAPVSSPQYGCPLPRDIRLMNSALVSRVDSASGFRRDYHAIFAPLYGDTPRSLCSRHRSQASPHDPRVGGAATDFHPGGVEASYVSRIHFIECLENRAKPRRRGFRATPNPKSIGSAGLTESRARQWRTGHVILLGPPLRSLCLPLEGAQQRRIRCERDWLRGR